jgi:hypothetical protein
MARLEHVCACKLSGFPIPATLVLKGPAVDYFWTFVSERGLRSMRASHHAGLAVEGRW